MSNTSGKIVYLDGIRGTAALCVFFHHFLLTFYSAYITFDPAASHGGAEIAFGKSVFSAFANGQFCVNIFFVLSGYVLSRRYFTLQQPAVLVSAAQRRFVRLYIPVAFVILLSFLLMQCKLYYNVPASRITHSEWWLGSFWSFTDIVPRLWHSLTIGTMFQGDSAFDNSMWTMCIELYGSLLVFAMLALTHGSRNKVAVLFFLFLFFACTGREDYTAFLLGITLNYTERWRAKAGGIGVAIGSTALLVAGLLLGSFPTRMNVTHTIYEHIPPGLLPEKEWLYIAGSYCVVLAFVLSPRLQRFMSLRVFRFLGYVSFSFYLLHPVLLGSLSCYTFLQVQQHMGYHQAVAVVLLITAAVALPASWLMTKWVDEPGMRLSKYLYGRWTKKRDPVTV